MVNHNIEGFRILGIDIRDLLTSENTACQLTCLTSKRFIVSSISEQDTFFYTTSVTTNNWNLSLFRKIYQGINSTNNGIVSWDEDDLGLTHQALGCILDIIG